MSIKELLEQAMQEYARQFVKCYECKYLMFSDCYGECRIGIRGIVRPNDCCIFGEKRCNKWKGLMKGKIQMKQNSIPFDNDGVIRLATKQGKAKKTRKDLSYQKDLINICLNCKKKKCKGCAKDKRFVKQRTLTIEELK